MKHRNRMMMVKIFLLFFTGTVVVLLTARYLLQQHFRAHPGVVHTPFFVQLLIHLTGDKAIMDPSNLPTEKVILEVRPDWSLEGAMHLKHLLGDDIKFYDNNR